VVGVAPLVGKLGVEVHDVDLWSSVVVEVVAHQDVVESL
jgi:hypothetical protein